MSDRIDGDIDPPLRKRLADLEIRRKTLIEAMSKFQDAKKSALFQVLQENCDEGIGSAPFGDRYPTNSIHRQINEDRSCSSSRRDLIQIARLETCPDDSHSYIKGTDRKNFRYTLPPMLANEDFHAEKSLKSTIKSRSWFSDTHSSTVTSLTTQCADSSHCGMERSLSSSRESVQRQDFSSSKQNLFQVATTCSSEIGGNDLGCDSNTRHFPHNDQPSFASNFNRQTHHLQVQYPSNTIRRHDAHSTHTSENLFSRAEKKYTEEFFEQLVSREVNEAPSDESTSFDDDGDENAALSTLDEIKNIAGTFSRRIESETFGGVESSRNDYLLSAQHEGDTFEELKKRNASLDSANLEEHSNLLPNQKGTKPYALGVDHGEHQILKKSSGLIHCEPLNRRKSAMEDVASRFVEDKITTTKKDEIEDKFLKLFVDDEVATPMKNSYERKHPLHGDENATEEPSEESGDRTFSRIRVDPESRSGNMEGGINDQMILLEKKLNMMISRKPLWQKALQDLYSEPSRSKVSVSASPSGITKPPSEAETICSIDSPYIPRPIKLNIHHQEDDDVIDIRTNSTVGNDVSDAGKNLRDVNSISEIDTMYGSWHIQNAKSYLDHPSECLSDEKSQEELDQEIKSLQTAESMTVGAKSIENREREIKALRRTESVVSAPLDEKEMLSTNVKQRSIQTCCSESNRSGSAIPSSNSKTPSASNHDVPLEGLSVGLHDSFMVQTQSKEELEREKNSRRHDQSEIETQSPSEAENRDIVPLHENNCIQGMNFQSNQSESISSDANSRKEIPILSVETASERLSGHLKEINTNDETKKEDSTIESNCFAPTTIEVEAVSPSTAKSLDVTIHDEDQMMSTYDEQQYIQNMYLQTDQWEMISPTANLKTPPVSNAKKHFFSENDGFGNVYRFDQQNVNMNSHYFDCGVTSDLSDDSTVSVAASSSCFSGENNNDDNVENIDDDIDDGDSEESSMKPPIPNEVTMLTDFTVQSIEYTFNNSTLESLGEESLVQAIQPNGAPVNYKLGNSNPTISNFEIKTSGLPLANNPEINKSSAKEALQKKVGALQDKQPKATYAEGLIKLLKNPSFLCQCTGPVVLNDIARTGPKTFGN